MMPWYVFALVDRPPAERQGRGLANALAVCRVPGAFAVVERRADVPPAELGALRTHDAVVARIAGAVPAILPVRFGTLLELDDLEETLAEREEELAEAFALVRGRVQFTWRVARGAQGAQGASGASCARGASGAGGASGASGARGAQGLGAEARRAKAAAMTGTEYLKHAAAKAAPPAAFRAIRETLRPLVVGERYQPATATLPNLRLRVTGPSPAFAFARD